MAKHRRASAISRFARKRFWVQAGFLALWLDPFMFRLHGACAPVFHCYSCPLALFACPIGILAQFSAIHMIPFVALGTLAVVGGLFGSVVCGWACPFGFLQDLLARIPTPKLELPAWSGYLRYVVLAVLVLAIPYWYGEKHPLFFCSVCPAGALEAGIGNLIWPSPVKLAILAVVLLAMLFAWRPWCTMLCPLGAIYGLSNHVSLLFLRFQPQECNDCTLCRSLCHGGGRPSCRVDDLRCVRCLECTRCHAVTVETILAGPRKADSNSRTNVEALK